ncbi:MAG TPA: uracil-DNA glycosylase [Gallionella sp.]|jgi:DNA polymerase|nr:uracil-DNA glycosylase [Gallionella sp.]
MDRREAVLRELNLYPQWKLRGGSGAATGQPAAPSLCEPVAPVQAVASAPEAAVEPEITTGSEQRREQIISELGWPALKTMVRDCTACQLRAGCTQTVFGVGDEQADWLFVGEGPGADEDAQGEPFVGQAGKLLDNMLLAIQLKRGKKVYIANIVKCRPPNDRTPERDEIATCLPYLQRKVELIKPKLIVALGKTAANALLGKDAALGSLRGKLHDFNGIPLLITYHPAYLLHSPMEKAKVWQDLCFATEVMRKL